MSWLNRVRNSIPFCPSARRPRSVAQMRECDAMVSTKGMGEDLSPAARAAGHHRPDRPRLRFDHCSITLQPILPPPQVREDPLKFRDSKRYTDRIKAARAATGEPAR